MLQDAQRIARRLCGGSAHEERREYKRLLVFACIPAVLHERAGRPALPADVVRPRAHTIRKVQGLPRHTLSGLKPTVTASPRGGVGSNRRE